MKTKKLMAAVAVALTLCVTIGGTLAWLTDTTDEVENTFTVGDVDIKLDEAKVGEDGKELTGKEAERVTSNTYKLYPGKEYDKDPKVTVVAEDETVEGSKDSEDCYVFVTVANGLKNEDDETIETTKTTKTIAEQMEANGWKAYVKNEVAVLYEGAPVYYQESVAHAGDEFEVFDTFTIADEVTGDQLANYEGKQIIIKAFAVQAEGFSSATQAWDSSFGK